MARAFNTEIFNATATALIDAYSGANFYELLGRADDLAIQVIVDCVASSPSAVKVYYQMSNDGRENTFKDVANVNISTPAAGSMDVFYPLSSATNGAFGRVRVDKTSMSQGTATLRVIACGRTRGS